MQPKEDTKRFAMTLDKIGRAARAAAQAECERQADKIMSLMKRRVPVRGGNLRRSIRRRPLPKPRIGVYVIAGDDSTETYVKAATRKGTRRKGYNYALAVEFGTSDTPAQPFFWPSYRQRKKAARSAVNRKIRKAVREALPQ